MKWLHRNANQSTTDLIGHLSGIPNETIWSKWIGGLIVPLCIAIYAIRCILSAEAVLWGQHNQDWELKGRTGIILGVAWLCAAIFLHCHYFWPTIRRLNLFTDVGKTVSAAGFAGCLIYVIGYVLAH